MDWLHTALFGVVELETVQKLKTEIETNSLDVYCKTHAYFSAALSVLLNSIAIVIGPTFALEIVLEVFPFQMFLAPTVPFLSFGRMEVLNLT